MKKFLIKSKFGIGRDFSVYDDETATNKVYSIDAKVGFGTKADILDAQGKLLYTAKGKVINVPRKLEFKAPNGNVVANVVARFSPIKQRLTLSLASGEKWELAGNFVGKNYKVKSGDRTVIEINQKWLTVRDKYFAEIADDVDVALALGLIWAVDIWREGKNN